MKRLITRAICHPLFVLSTLYLIELMHNVDYSVVSALLVVAARTMSRMVALSHAFGHRRSCAAARGGDVHRFLRVRDEACRIRHGSPRLTEDK